MTQKEFERKQEEMEDAELIKFAEKELSKLAETGGRSHTMNVPPKVTDTDMIFGELIKRFTRVVMENNQEINY